MKDGSIQSYVEGPMIDDLHTFGQPTYTQLWNATIVLGKLMNGTPLGEADVESAALAYVWVSHPDLTQAVRR